eukprot:SAG25_NODE_120_length_14682_cov_4.224782_3_plen_736_part_00
MNINQLVNDKKDTLASSNKPLNQGVGPDLIEILATRKLLEEKQAAARDMAMKQEQTGGTIAEQQEQKLLGLTQKEIANQTGGILAQRAQQPQQKKPQQGGIMGAMGGASRPPMGGAPRPPMGGAPRPPMSGAPRPPMSGGIAGSGQRPTVRRASGGIIGYNQGGDINAARAKAQKHVQNLSGTFSSSSPEYQTGLQKILQTLGTQSSPEEKEAIKKVLVDAGLETGAAAKGIATFNKGGLNDAQRRAKEYQESKGGSMVQALTEALKRRGLTREQFEALSPNEKQAIRAELPQIMQEQKQERDNYMSPMARLKDATSPQALAEKRDNAQKKIMKANNPEMFAQAYPEEVKPNTAELDTSALATPNTFTGAPKPSTADMGGLGVLRPQGGAPKPPMGGAQAGGAPKPPMGGAQAGGAPKPPMGGAQAGGPQIGSGQEFDFSVSPTTSKTQVSDRLGSKFGKQLKERMNTDAGKLRDEERLLGRFETDQRVGGLKDLYSQRMEEKERLANDPHAQYKRRMANIFATRGAKGQAYRQNVLDSQNKNLNLIDQKINDFASITNTEINLMEKVDARAASVYKAASEDLATAMQLFADIEADNLTVYQKDVELQQDVLIKQADARLRADTNYNYAEANRIAETSNNVDALKELNESISKIQRENLEAAQNILDPEERKIAVDKVSVKDQKLYSSLQMKIIKRLRKLNNMAELMTDSGDEGNGNEPAYNSAETNAFNKQMNQ